MDTTPASQGGTMRTHHGRGKGPRRGFTLIEVAFSLMIFLMTVLMFGAAFPAAVRAAQFGSDYNQAVEIAQHKVEQLRTTGLSNPDAASLGNAGIIDKPQPAGGVSNPAGSPAGAFSYSFTGVDALTNYYAPGCQGVLTISPDAAIAGADDVTVTLTWSRAGGPTSTYATRAKIVNVQ